MQTLKTKSMKLVKFSRPFEKQKNIMNKLNKSYYYYYFEEKKALSIFVCRTFIFTRDGTMPIVFDSEFGYLKFTLLL